MLIRLHHTVRGALSAALGGLGLAVSAPFLPVLTDPTVCLGLTPEQSLVVHLHLVAASPACAGGAVQATSLLAPVIGITLAVSLTALLIGPLMVAVGLGGGIALRAILRRAGTWLRRLWDPVVAVILPSPTPIPVPIVANRYRARLEYLPSQRRGPPGCGLY